MRARAGQAKMGLLPSRPSSLVVRSPLTLCLFALWACSSPDDPPAPGATAGTGGASAGIGGKGGTGGKSGSGGKGGSAGASAAGGSGGTGGVPPAGTGTSNLFSELLGKTQAEVDSKVVTAVNRFFGIGTGEPTTPTLATGYRCYYEFPQDPSLAFVWAADSNDVRSEGMSYGMMIAAQMDMQTEFDRLWKFAKTYMQYPGDTATTAWKYYFRWRGTVNTSSSNWSTTFDDDEVMAPDGDEYFTAALYVAHQRWGSGGSVNYKQEADNIAAAMLHNGTSNGSRFQIIHSSQNMVVFVPFGNSNNFTDPSYHLPAFYELFAEFGPPGDAAKWRSVAATSRTFLAASAHASTGLHPDYATFQGQPTTANAGDGHDDFRYDAWRVLLNMSVDYAWYSGSASMKTQVEKYHAFFANHLGTNNVSSSLFNVDGSGAEGGSSTALTAMLGAGALASAAANRTTYVQNLWNVSQQSGQYRYYQESVYLLGLLATAGKFSRVF